MWNSKNFEKSKIWNSYNGEWAFWNIDCWNDGKTYIKASGLVVVAHNSAGPKLDIIQEDNRDTKGFLCRSDENFI